MRFSIVMVAVLQDGTAAANRVLVDSDKLLLDDYNDELYDNVADAFGNLVTAWLESAATTEELQ